MDQYPSRPRRMTRQVFGLMTGLVISCLLMVVRAPAQEPPSWSRPIQSGFFKNGEIVESSGIVASRANPGVYWTHNDSDNRQVLFAIDETGKDIAQYLIDARMEDWEDIACARIDGKNYLIVADVGDNGAKRKYCKLHVFIEPVIAMPGAAPTKNPNDPAATAPKSDKHEGGEAREEKPAPPPAADDKLSDKRTHKEQDKPHDDPERKEPDLPKLQPEWTIRYSYETGPVDCEAVAIDVHARKIILISKVYGDRCAAFELDFVIPKPPAHEQPEHRDHAPKPDQPAPPPPPTSQKTIRQTLVSHQPAPQPDDHEKADKQPPQKRPEPKPVILEAKKLTNFRAVVVTAADISADSKKLLLATYAQTLEFTREGKQTWTETLTGKPRYLPTPLRRQGEGICYSLDGKAILWTSEGARAAIWKSTHP